jgi:hypothetical protein
MTDKLKLTDETLTEIYVGLQLGLKWGALDLVTAIRELRDTAQLVAAHNFGDEACSTEKCNSPACISMRKLREILPEAKK